MKTIYRLLFALSFCCFGVVNAAVTLPVFPSATFNVTSYGASSSTSKDNTSGIQAAINACNTAGGGTVVIPSGTFLSGPLTLKNNVNLQISSGATLRLLPYGNGNGSPAGSYPNNGTADNYFPLISAKGAKNIAVSGTGTIDGQGAAWWAAYLVAKAIGRPGIIRFDGCTTLAITGVTIINAPNVHITIGQGSSNSTIANVTINSPSNSPNTDGIDTWSPNINITNCSITCGDDNIAMDSESQNVTIKHCKFGTGHGCSIGSYAGNISNILVDSCTFNGTSTGMRLKTSRDRGGVETNITYSNITMTNVPTPIYIVSYYPKVPSSPTADPAQAITASTPSWTNVTLKNAVITGSDNAGSVWGLPERSISNVTFDNVQISAKTGMVFNFATGVLFKNCSKINVTSGNAVVSTYNATVSGVNFTTGQPTTACTVGPATLTKQGAGSSSQTVSLGTAITPYSFTWTNASTVTVTGMPAGITVDINNTTQTVSLSGTPTKAGAFDFTVTTVGGTTNVSKTGTITVTSNLPATITKQGAGSSNQTITIGSAIVPYSFSWSNASTVTVTGMPTGIVVDVNNSTQVVSISGTPTQLGVFNFVVTTTGGNPDTTKRGSITINNVVTGLSSENAIENGLSYPNPFSEQFTIAQNGLFDYQILSLDGIELGSGHATDKVEVGTKLQPGLYIVKTQGRIGAKTFKILKTTR